MGELPRALEPGWGHSGNLEYTTQWKPTKYGHFPLLTSRYLEKLFDNDLPVFQITPSSIHINSSGHARRV